MIQVVSFRGGREFLPSVLVPSKVGGLVRTRGWKYLGFPFFNSFFQHFNKYLINLKFLPLLYFVFNPCFVVSGSPWKRSGEGGAGDPVWKETQSSHLCCFFFISFHLHRALECQVYYCIWFAPYLQDVGRKGIPVVALWKRAGFELPASMRQDSDTLDQRKGRRHSTHRLWEGLT